MTPYNIPTLPTDNLYKFYSVAGIIIVILSITFTYLPFFDLQDRRHKLELEVAENTLEVKFLNEDIESYKSRRDELVNKLSEFEVPNERNKLTYEKYMEQLNDIRTDSEWRTYLEFIYKYEENVFPERAEFKEISDLKNRIKEASRKVELKVKKNELISKKIKSEFHKSIVISIICLIAFYLGIKLSIKGFKLWKTQVQDLIDRKNEVEISLLEADLKKNNKKK